MIRALLLGAGRMARSVAAVAAEYDDIDIVAQSSRRRPEARESGKDIPFFENLAEVGEGAAPAIDLLIDFSLPEGTLAAAHWCAENRVALLTGVTGIGGGVFAALDEASEAAPVLWSPNLSYGVNVLAGLLQVAGQALAPAMRITIEDVHHEGKKDAPSGTALFLARQIHPPRNGLGGSDPARIAEDFPGIEFKSRREGSVIGDHRVTFTLRDETLTMAHHAADRRLFARGALEAGRWLTRQPAGRYTAADWIRGAAAGGA